MIFVPVLSTLDTGKPYTGYVDASGIADRGVLLQEDEHKKLHPLASINKQLQPPEVNYIVGESEVLAMVHALPAWRCLLEGAEFTIWTDHSNLTSFITSPTLNGRRSRWASSEQQFLPGMTMRYKKGVENMADASSRRADHAKPAATAAAIAWYALLDRASAVFSTPFVYLIVIPGINCCTNDAHLLCLPLSVKGGDKRGQDGVIRSDGKVCPSKKNL